MTVAEMRTQAMYESETEEIWENINRGNPAEAQMTEAAKSLEKAVRKINEGLDMVSDAMNEVLGTVAEDKLISLLDDYEDLLCDLRKIRDDFKKGRC